MGVNNQHLTVTIPDNDIHSPRKYYDGEAYLCPPDQKPFGMQATIGLIQLYLHDEPRSVSAEQKSDLTKYFKRPVQDSLCRQMGFSMAAQGGLQPLAAFESNYTFKNCQK